MQDYEAGWSLRANRSEPELPAVREILDYFLRNPAAVDSLTGIARWRLMEDFVERSVDATQAALNWLVHEGYVQKLENVGRDRMFRLNAKNRKAAEVFLKGAGKRRKPNKPKR